MVFGIPLTAENHYFISDYYKTGLSNTSISGITQDSSGFLWFSTKNGLDRFNGTTFKIYENDPFNENSLSNNLIQTMYMDKDDILWLGTYSGLDRFDTKTETFKIYKNTYDDATTLSNNLIIAICKDSHNNLWVGTMNGLNVFDSKTGTFKRFFHSETDPNSLADNTIRALFKDSDGNLWIGTDKGGLDRYNYKTKSFIHHTHNPKNKNSLPANQVMDIDEDTAGNLWIATWDYGLSKFNSKTGIFKNYKIPEARAYCINAKQTGIVRIGSWGGGLWELNTTKQKLSVYKHNSSREDSLSNNIVYSLFIDNAGSVWVGTNGGGINRLSEKPKEYKIYKNDPDNSDSLSAGKIDSIMEDHLGKIWIGLYNGGLNVLDPKTNHITHYKHDPSDTSSLSNDIINYIYEDSRHTIWVLTNNGLNKFNPQTNSFTHYFNDKNNPDSIASNIVFYMLEEPKTGNLWIATYTKGLEYFDLKTHTFKHFNASPTNKNTLSDPVVSCIQYDTDGNLWVGTNHGLNRMDKHKRCIHYFHDVTDKNSIPSDAIKSFLLDSQGQLWMAFSTGGFACYNKKLNNFVTYNKNNGLPSNTVLSILEDKHGDLWIITDKGLAILDYKSKSIRIPSLQEELTDGKYSSGHLKTSSGEFYLGGTQALYVFNPDNIEMDYQITPIKITDFRIFNKEKKLDKVIYLKKQIKIPYTENNFGFSFSALNYRNPGKDFYGYKLEGFDKNWIFCGSRQTAEYTNIPGGNYVFKVICRNNAGIWNTQGTSIVIKVSSPPWLQPWAVILYILGIIFIIVIIIIFITRHNLIKKVAELTSLKKELENANSRLKSLSQNDSLTGIANRRRLNEINEIVHFNASKNKKSIAAIMLDIDHFKIYNDTYGHLAGDKCLCQIAQAITQSLHRNVDFAARYGGEEFFILLPETPLEGAQKVACRIQNNVNKLSIPNINSPVKPFVTVSIGIAVIIPETGTETTELIEMADKALYRAKETGRNKISI